MGRRSDGAVAEPPIVDDEALAVVPGRERLTVDCQGTLQVESFVEVPPVTPSFTSVTLSRQVWFLYSTYRAELRR